MLFTYALLYRCEAQQTHPRRGDVQASLPRAAATVAVWGRERWYKSENKLNEIQNMALIFGGQVLYFRLGILN